MKKVKAGIIGMGYIGGSHIEALRRIGFAEVAAVADTNEALARRKAEEYHIPKCCLSLDELLQDKDIDVIHNCTPNNLHTEVNKAVLRAGKHIFSEKPLARTYEEAKDLLDFAAGYPNLIKAVNFNYRMNPLMLDMRDKTASGELGTPWLVHGSYLQDWLVYETDYNWRIDPAVCGPSRCVADIGSHWMDAVQFILGAKITEVCADLGAVFPTRKKSFKQVETFSVSSEAQVEDIPVKTEDYGSVLFCMDNGVRGVFHTSEVSAGHGCYFQIEINGSKASISWNQETADHMWMGFRDRDNLSIIRDPARLSPQARNYSHLAKGHPEGWNDAFRSSLQSFYQFIAEGRKLGADPCDFATFEDAAYIIRLTKAILASNETRGWVKVTEV